jgi:hypothetical protein
MNFNVIDKKLKTVYILISDVFFHKKMSQNFWATIMPFGPVTNLLISGTASGFRGEEFERIHQSETRIACGGHIC